MTMNRKHISVLLLLTALMTSGAWTKEPPVTPAGLLAKSDALYFAPAAHGVTDLAMDITVDAPQTDPVGKLAQIAYYYAGEQNQWVEVNQIPDEHEALRRSILDEVTPVERFIMPTPAVESFAGMTMELVPETRLMAGVPETAFYWVKGTAKKDHPLKAGDPKTFQVLLDRHGRLFEIAAVSTRNEHMTGAIENIQLADGLHISRLKTRYFTTDGNLLWVFETITYGPVGNMMLPSSVTVEYRDNNDHPAKDHQTLTLRFSHYRLNKGVAADELARLARLSASHPALPDINTPIPTPLPPPPLLTH